MNLPDWGQLLRLNLILLPSVDDELNLQLRFDLIQQMKMAWSADFGPLVLNFRKWARGCVINSEMLQRLQPSGIRIFVGTDARLDRSGWLKLDQCQMWESRPVFSQEFLQMQIFLGLSSDLNLAARCWGRRIWVATGLPFPEMLRTPNLSSDWGRPISWFSDEDILIGSLQI